MTNLFKPIALSILAVFVFTFVVGFGTEIAHSPAGWDGALLIASVASVIAALVTLLWGVPTHMLLKRYSKTQLHWYLLSGVFPGFIIVFVLYPFGKDTFNDLLVQSVMFGVVGMLAAGVFGFFANSKNA